MVALEIYEHARSLTKHPEETGSPHMCERALFAKGQLLQGSATEHRGGLLRDDVGAWARVIVAPLDQQPLRLGAGPRALQGKAAAQLLAVQHEHGVPTLLCLGPGHPATLLVGAAIPDHY